MKQNNPPVRIKASLLADAKKALKALAKTPPDDFRLKEAVYQLIPEILDARAGHRSDDAIAEMLRSIGIQISASTLGSYVREYLRNQKPTKTPRTVMDPELLSDQEWQAQIGERDDEQRMSGGSVYRPLSDGPDLSDEELVERVTARNARELEAILLDHEDEAAPLDVVDIEVPRP